MEQIVKKIKWLYAAVLVVSCFPLTLGYLMHTGEVQVWAQKITNSILYKMIGSVVLWHICIVLLIQLVTFTGMFFLMKTTYEDEVAHLMGVTLYMTCPYRLFVIYQQVDMKQAVALALLPWFVWSFRKIKRKWAEVFSVPMGAIFSVFVFLLLSARDGVTMQNIATKGYVLADFLTMWKFSDRPGLGLGLMLGSVVLLWVLFVAEGKLPKERKLLLCSVLVLGFMATRYFPWEMVQRVSGLFLQWVSLLGSPAIFWGIACFILSFLIPWVVEELSKEEKKELAKGSWIVIWLGAMAGAVYFCNTLTFYTPGI